MVSCEEIGFGNPGSKTENRTYGRRVPAEVVNKRISKSDKGLSLTCKSVIKILVVESFPAKASPHKKNAVSVASLDSTVALSEYVESVNRVNEWFEIVEVAVWDNPSGINTVGFDSFTVAENDNVPGARDNKIGSSYCLPTSNTYD